MYPWVIAHAMVIKSDWGINSLMGRICVEASSDSRCEENDVLPSLMSSNVWGFNAGFPLIEVTWKRTSW